MNTDQKKLHEIINKITVTISNKAQSNIFKSEEEFNKCLEAHRVLMLNEPYLNRLLAD